MIQPNPLLTLALFSYKQEAYIREAVLAAFSQTYSPLEIIISDDASPDGTYAIIEDMAANYRGPHKVILNRNRQNMGIGAHVEKVFGLASGEWIVGAAGDDVSLPNRCEVLHQAAKSAGEDCRGLASGWILIDEQGEVVESGNADAFLQLQKDSMQTTKLEACRAVLFDRTNQLPGCSTMWHRSVIRDWPPFIPELSWEDMTFSCRAHLSGTICLIDDKLVKYRITPGAVTNTPKHSGSFSARIRTLIQEQNSLFASQVGLRQFLLDLNYCSQQQPNSLEVETLIGEVDRKIERYRLICEWMKLPTLQRLSRFISGNQYPFGERKIKDLKHLFPLKFLNRVATSFENIAARFNKSASNL